MNDYLYSIYDRLAGRYGSPFAACNDMVAARLALMIKSGYNEAFDGVYRIGVFGNSSGQIEPCDPVSIGDTVKEVLDMLKSVQTAQSEKEDRESEVLNNG